MRIGTLKYIFDRIKYINVLMTYKLGWLSYFDQEQLQLYLRLSRSDRPFKDRLGDQSGKVLNEDLRAQDSHDSTKNSAVLSYRLPLSARIKDTLEDADSNINQLIPLQVISPTTNDFPEPFRSEKILSSLFELGIGIEAGFHVLDILKKPLFSFLQGREEINTSDLRQMVSRAIYNLEAAEFDEYRIQEWGDRYSRRYGQAEKRVKVLDDKGNESLLDFKFIREKLIPDLIEGELQVSYSVVRSTITADMNLRHMVNEIFANIKRLNLYSISYATLLGISKDMAIQPPHPWFVQRPFDNPTISYDLGRAERHCARMAEFFDQSDIYSCRHSCLECIHHSCSAILAYYGAFIGCGHLTPLYNLIHTLKIFRDNEMLWEYTSIKQIEGDLQAIEITFLDFMAHLLETKKNISSLSKEMVQKQIENAKSIFDIATNLIESRNEIVSEVEKWKDELKNNRQIRIEDFAVDIFRRIPKFKFVSTVHNNYFLIKHTSHSPILRKLRTSFLVAPINRIGEIGQEELQSTLEILETSEEYPKTAVLIANGDYSSDCFSYVKEKYNQPINAILLKSIDFLEIVETNDRVAKFESLVTRHYETIGQMR